MFCKTKFEIIYKEGKVHEIPSLCDKQGTSWEIYHVAFPW